MKKVLGRNPGSMKSRVLHNLIPQIALLLFPILKSLAVLSYDQRRPTIDPLFTDWKFMFVAGCVIAKLSRSDGEIAQDPSFSQYSSTVALHPSKRILLILVSVRDRNPSVLVNSPIFLPSRIDIHSHTTSLGSRQTSRNSLGNASQ